MQNLRSIARAYNDEATRKVVIVYGANAYHLVRWIREGIERINACEPAPNIVISQKFPEQSVSAWEKYCGAQIRGHTRRRYLPRDGSPHSYAAPRVLRDGRGHREQLLRLLRTPPLRREDEEDEEDDDDDDDQADDDDEEHHRSTRRSPCPRRR